MGDSHCYDFMDYLFKIIWNCLFKSVLVNNDYLKVVYVLFNDSEWWSCVSIHEIILVQWYLNLYGEFVCFNKF